MAAEPPGPTPAGRGIERPPRRAYGAEPERVTGRTPRRRQLVAAAGLALIVVLAVVDYLTGPDLRFYILYWPPITALAWFCGRRWGYAAVVLSTAASALANGPEWAAARYYILWWNLAASLVSFTFLAFLVSTLRRMVEHERETARTDFLTSLANGRAFDEALAVELARSRRSRAPVSLAYVDIDDFKLVNDRLGHGAGDAALREFAHRLWRGVREHDIVARLGGDEFAVLLPETAAVEARVVVERLRRTLAEPVAGVGWPLTASVGAVTCLDATATGDELIRSADGLMYGAKQGGKDAARFSVLDAAGRPGTG